MLHKNKGFTLSATTSILTLIASGFLLANQAAAQVVIQKPGAVKDSAEAGRMVAQYDKVTVIGAMQDTLLKNGETPAFGNPVGSQGAVYVFEDAQATPKATYQFPGNDNYFRQTGARVAASAKWLAFTDTSTGSGASAHVYIVGKDGSNNWRTCPTGIDGIDCSDSVDVNGLNTGKALKSIEFDPSVSPSAKSYLNQNIAISDNYLVTANVAAGVLDFYRYDTSQNKWIKEWTYDDPVDANKTGSDIAIDGERVVVSAPQYNSTMGRFYAFERNASTQQWQLTHTVNGPGSTSNLASSLDFHNTRILARLGPTTVAYYRFEGPDINLKSILNTSHDVVKVSIFNDTAVVSYGGATSNAFGTYKLNTVTNAWGLVQNIPITVVPAGPGNTTLAHRDIDLHQNNIAIGWPGRGALNSSNVVVNNVGAVVLKDFSASNCKSVINLVPNCSFDIPTATNWSLLTYNGANASPDYSNGELKTTINDDGYDFWHIQARTAVKLASAGTYTLRFNARADWTRSIVVNLGHNGTSDNNWQSYAQNTVTLSTHMQTYTLTLNSLPQDLNAVLDFNFGNAGNSPVTIDEIYLSRNP